MLDNFEHLLEAREALVDLLTGCPSASALVTSRVALRVRGEREYRIGPLEPASSPDEPAPAVTLFLDRARAGGAEPAADALGTVEQICRRVDCLPLAIELAASRAVVLSPDEMLSRMDDRLGFLTGGPHDLPHRTVLTEAVQLEQERDIRAGADDRAPQAPLGRRPEPARLQRC